MPAFLQDRIAQRSFRKRKKAYFVDLEKKVIEKTGRIQAITKSNQSLMEMMEKLQRENIAVSLVIRKRDSSQDLAGIGLEIGQQGDRKIE